jgi:ATP-binding cassette subfamily C protein CydCD
MTKSASEPRASKLGAPRDVRTLVVRLVSDVPNGWRRLLVALLLAVCASAASVALMGVSAWLLSFAATHPNVSEITLAATGVRTFGTSRGVFRYFERLTGHDLALRMQAALRLSTYTKLARTTLLGARTGDMLLRVTADVEAIMDVVVRVALPFSSAVIVILGTSLVMAVFSPLSAAVLLGCSIVAGIVLPLVTQVFSRRADESVAPARAEMANEVFTLAHNAADLAAYGRGEAQLAKLDAVDARLKEAERHASFTRGLAAGGQLIVMGIAVAAALVIGADAVVNGALSGPNLAVLCLTPLALHESFGDLTKAAQTLTQARTSLSRILGLLAAEPVGIGDRVAPQSEPVAVPPAAVVDSTPQPGSRPGGGSLSGLSRGLSGGLPNDSSKADDAPPVPALTLTDLTIGWPGANESLISDINLGVTRGERVVVTGASGIGKTTLAATILGLIPPVAGSVDAPGQIAYLAQDAHIFATTVAENVRIGNPQATDAQIESALAKAGAAHLEPLRIVGEDGTTLSGGEARRLAMARIFVSATIPDVVILDEPTEHLDQETASALMDDALSSFAGSALLIATHDPDVISRCERELHLA